MDNAREHQLATERGHTAHPLPNPPRPPDGFATPRQPATCPAPACTRTLAAGMHACPGDWRRLPRRLRQAIVSAHRIGDQNRLATALTDARRWYATNDEPAAAATRPRILDLIEAVLKGAVSTITDYPDRDTGQPMQVIPAEDIPHLVDEIHRRMFAPAFRDSGAVRAVLPHVVAYVLRNPETGEEHPLASKDVLVVLVPTTEMRAAAGLAADAELLSEQPAMRERIAELEQKLAEEHGHAVEAADRFRARIAELEAAADLRHETRQETEHG